MSISPDSILVEEENGKGRYYVTFEDEEDAELTFSRTGENVVVLSYTGVPPALRERGIGAALVERAVDDAREDGHTIMPLCSFAAAQFERHPEWSDLLEPQP